MPKNVSVFANICYDIKAVQSVIFSGFINLTKLINKAQIEGILI